MPLASHMLTKAEMDGLDRLFGIIYKNRSIRLYIRQGLIQYCPDAIRTDTLSRLMRKPSALRRDHFLFATAYDFALERLSGMMDSTSLQDGSKEDIRMILDELEEMRRKRLGHYDDIEDSTDLGPYLDPVPPGCCGTFFGYRRSATVEDIIRFTLNVRLREDPGTRAKRQVRFDNDYVRGEAHWSAQGTGHCLRDTVYLYGHAVDANDRSNVPRGLGLRFLALREFGNTRCLNGLVMSMATDGVPIAARILAVPVDMHRLSPDMKELQRKDPKGFVQQMISRALEYEDIKNAIGHIFAPKEDYVLEMIRNATSSVLTCSPFPDASLARKENYIREHPVGIGGMYTPADEVFRYRYEKFLDSIIEELRKIPPG